MWYQSRDLRLERCEANTAVLWFDVQDQRYNVFTLSVLHQLEAALDVLQKSPPDRMLIRSGKPSGFFAGADLRGFAAIAAPAQAEHLSGLGQRLFRRLAELPCCTFAVIFGPCLGGGLELALACDYRLVVDRPDTVLGFPEVELGLIPAWTGCQSLPRLLGIEKALKGILTGRKWNAPEACKVGLADKLLPAGSEMQAIPSEVLTDLPRRKRAWTVQAARSLRQTLLERNPLGRALLFHLTRKTLAAKVPDDMPAPAAALKAVEIGIRSGLEAGLAAERRAAAELSQSEACRQLIGLFFVRERYRKMPSHLADVSRPEIRKVGVVGAGVMGAGIAQLALVRGYSVVLKDVNAAALQAGMQRIRELCDKAVSRGILSAGEMQQRLQNTKTTTEWDGFADADLVIEAVVEDVGIKHRVYRELEEVLHPQALLATNTSSLSLRELSAELKHPGRFGALHFFNPVHKMPLVEVGRTDRTMKATVAALTAFALDLGKVVVQVGDSPGFVVNRVLLPYLYEAMRLLLEGAEPQELDRGIRRFGMPMGPYELLDQIGLDVAAHVTHSLQPRFADRFPGDSPFDRLVLAGLLGQKSGQGFYRYRNSKPRPHAAWRALLDIPTGLRLRLDPEDLRERLIYPMLNEAAACLGEGIVAEPQDVDVAMVFGTGWAPHRGGPLHFADHLGVGNLVASLKELAERFGPRFRPCPELLRRHAEGRPFYPPDFWQKLTA